MKRTLSFALLSLAACNDEAGFDTEPAPVQDVVTSSHRPPALSGGTMLLIDDGARAVVADPDRDRVLIADLRSDRLERAIALPDGAEPGRVVRDDTSGLVHVALRGSGALATIDPDRGELVSTRAVCADPRGVALSRARGSASLIVACASGEWVELDARPQGGELGRHYLEPDLRDVVVLDDASLVTRRLWISSFRSAEVLTVGPDGAIQLRSRAPTYVHKTSGRSYEADVAWRMIPTEDGALMIHQRATTSQLGADLGGGNGSAEYYASSYCSSSAVHSAVAAVSMDGQVAPSRGLGVAVLPLDVALLREDPSRGRPTLFAYAATGSNLVAVVNQDDPLRSDGCDEDRLLGTAHTVGEPIAVGFRDNGESTELVVQLREPAVLLRYDAWTFEERGKVWLGGATRADSGHALFHGNPDGIAAVACASCHPEGGDDGHTWSFPEVGRRRTQSLAGDVLATAPFHWEGDLPDLESLVRAVYVGRMGGAPQIPERVDALEQWLAGMPAPGRPRAGRVDVDDPAAVARGRALFESRAVGCADCHSGPTLTDNTTRDVGTGEPLQVPSLSNLAARAPYMHDGCATTLAERFSAECGGDAHGDVSTLDRGQRRDLLAYLLSL